MSWESFSNAIHWFDAENPDPTMTGYPLTELSASDQATILARLQYLYENSVEARAIMERALSAGLPIVMGESNLPGYAIANTGASPPYYYIGYNLDQIDKTYYINSQGELVKENLDLALIHELAHFWPANDTLPGDRNSSTYDFAGGVLPMQNQVAIELGYTDHIQPSYDATVYDLSSDIHAPYLALGSSATLGNSVDIVRFGDVAVFGNTLIDVDDFIDMSARTDGKSTLLFGFGGNDAIRGSSAIDYIYGGAGNDIILSSGGSDEIWGGDVDGHPDLTDHDTMSYLASSIGISVTLGQDAGTATVTKGNSADQLRDIESIIGSELADTLVLTSLTAAVADYFDYVDLGGAGDTLDISGLAGSVTVDLRDANDQTVTFGGAVLHVRNAETVVGAGGDDRVYSGTGSGGGTITAGAGSDTIYLAGSNQIVDGGDGFDTLDLSVAVTGARISMGTGSVQLDGNGTSTITSFEEVIGGGVSNRMYGDGSGTTLTGGTGVNYIEGSGDDILQSGTGDTYFAVSNGATVISGLGNDYIDVSGSEPVTIKFGVGSGHDMIDSYFAGFQDGETRFDLIHLQGLTKDDIELIWDFTEDSRTDVYPWDADGDGQQDEEYSRDWHARWGEAAIRIKSTGETLYLGEIYYSHEDFWANYELFVGNLFTTNIDAHNVRAAYNIANEVGPEPLPGSGWWDQYTSNADDVQFWSVDADIFTFDGVTRLSFFDLFDFRSVISQPLPAEVTAAADVLSRIGAGGGGSVVGGSASSDGLNGTSGDDDLLGGAGNDTLNGGAGDDFVRGGEGDDIIVGGSGNDSLNGGDGHDTLDYSSAGSRVVVNLALTTAQNTGGAGTDAISEVEDIIGSAFNDVLTGGASNNKVIGGAGNDTIDGGAGDDILDGGADRDIVSYASASAGVVVNLSLSGAQNTGGAGIDTLISIESIVGSNFDDILIGSDEGNNIKGGAGNDIISGSGLNDVLEGGEGNDTLNGEAGFDVVSYSTATAGVTVSLAISTAQDTGGAGIDTIVGLERLTGSAYADVLGGSSEANIIAGGAGNDRITGGNGSDTLTGDAGADTFIFDAALNASGNVDKITDFVSGLDTIELKQSIFLALDGQGGLSSSQFQIGTAANDAQDRIIYDQATGNIYYDADGSGAGAQILFAQVTAGLTLASTDFTIV